MDGEHHLVPCRLHRLGPAVVGNRKAEEKQGGDGDPGDEEVEEDMRKSL